MDKVALVVSAIEGYLVYSLVHKYTASIVGVNTTDPIALLAGFGIGGAMWATWVNAKRK